MTRFLILAWFIACSPLQILAISRLELTKRILQDTVIQSDTLSVTPYYGKTQAKALGNFAVVTSDKIAFQTYAGFNVMNTLRGHVPNLSISPNASYTTGGLRTNECLLVIDGLPYNNNINNYYNLNSFEYSSINAFSSGNATVLYGEPGSNGAIFLKSKTGEGFNKPTVEFNSFSSFTWEDDNTVGLMGQSQAETSKQWMFTNTAAYQQDFGKIDTRISYQYSFLPDGSNTSNFKSGNHALKINTGFNITPKLSARLILDDIYTKTEFVPNPQNSTTVFKNIQGNLILRYQVLDWLQLSSQNSIGSIKKENEISFPDKREYKDDQKRVFSNLFASARKLFFQRLSLTAFAGAQVENLDIYKYAGNSSLVYTQTSEYKTFSAFGGVGLGFNNYFFADFNYRKDQLSTLPSDDDSYPTYATTLSFVFSEALGLKSPWFSFGKIRGSNGKTSIMHYQGYPYFKYVSLDVSQSGLYSKKMNEAGMDLSFFGNRLSVSASYFENKFNEIVYPTDPNTGFQSTTITIKEFENEGLELIVGGSWIKKSTLSIDSKLIWANYKTKIDGESTSSQNFFIANPNPDWTGSFLNQITWKNFYTSFLINVRKGGDVYNPYISNGTIWGNVEDASQIKLRDLSIGYKFSTGLLNRLNIQEAQISLSGRNFWILYSKSERDSEQNLSTATTYQKSASLSLTLMF